MMNYNLFDILFPSKFCIPTIVGKIKLQLTTLNVGMQHPHYRREPYLLVKLIPECIRFSPTTVGNLYQQLASA